MQNLSRHINNINIGNTDTSYFVLNLDKQRYDSANLPMNVGISYTPSGKNIEMDFSWYLGLPAMTRDVLVAGVYKPNLNNPRLFQNGDVYRIWRNNGNVEFYVNGLLDGTFPDKYPDRPMYLEAVFYDVNKKVENLYIYKEVLKTHDTIQTTEMVAKVDGYKYGFQNQERDDEIKGAGNSYNYTYRMHDTRLGRFFAVDPLFRKYPYNSSYAFSENVVINAVELEGMEKRDVIGVNGNKATVYGPKSQAGIDQELANSKTPATALDYAKQNMTNNLKNLSANIFSKNNVNNSSNGDLGKALKSSSNVDLKTPVSKVSGLNFTIETSTTTTIKDNDSPITTTINAKNLKVEEVSVTGSNITINHSKEETSIGTKYLSFGKTLKANEISINISIPTNFQGNTVNTSIKFNYTGLKVVAQEVGKSLNNNQSPFLIPVPYYLIFGL